MTHSEVDRDNNTTNTGKLYCFVLGNSWYLELKLTITAVEPIAKQTGEDNEMPHNFAIFASQETRQILNNPEVF